MAERRVNGAQYPLNGSSSQARSGVGTSTDPFPPPFPPMEQLGLEQLRREYVAGGGWAWYGEVARTLPQAIDDVTGDFGDDLYDRMLFDPQIAAVTTIFKAGILETGLYLDSSVRSRYEPDFELASEICNEAQRMIAEFDGSIDDVLWNLLDCVPFGNEVAEQSYKLAPARKDGRKILVLDKLKVRPRRSTVYAVDIYINLIGLLIRVPPNASPWSSTMVFGPDEEPFNLLPPHKFVITNFRPKNNDPRGSSLLRPAYSAWWRKQQIIPEYLRYLSQFAGPSLIGFVGEDATPQTDTSGAVVTAEQVMLGALQALRNGTAAAFPFGAKVDPLVMNGDGAAFLRAIDHCDQQITKAVLTQELATEEGKHMARAAAEVHQDVLDTLIRHAKLGFAAQLRNQLFKRWVVYNWGEAAAHLAPKVNLGKSIQREHPALWGAVSQLMGQGYLVPSQLQQLDEMVGLPVRDELELYPIEAENDPTSTQQIHQPPAAPTKPGQPAAKQPEPKIITNPSEGAVNHPGAGFNPVPDNTKGVATVPRPSLPGLVGVRAHTRKRTQKPIQVVDINDGGFGALPSPNSGTFG